MTALRTPLDYFYLAHIVASDFILAKGLKMMMLERSTFARIETKPPCGREQWNDKLQICILT